MSALDDLLLLNHAVKNGFKKVDLPFKVTPAAKKEDLRPQVVKDIEVEQEDVALLRHERGYLYINAKWRGQNFSYPLPRNIEELPNEEAQRLIRIGATKVKRMVGQAKWIAMNDAGREKLNLMKAAADAQRKVTQADEARKQKAAAKRSKRKNRTLKVAN